MSESKPWHIFTGEGSSRLAPIKPAPPWRMFNGKVPSAPPFQIKEPYTANDSNWLRALTYITPPDALDAINAALLLRRPLLVTGKPGTGKSTLAYRIAYELALGPVLVWAINSRSTLKEGLYDYDAIARLNDQRLQPNQADQIGKYLSLRALGTALLPGKRPRVLLIDELDKADPDLPNDLLHVFEEGWFEIPELQRHVDKEISVRLMPSSRDDPDNPPMVTVQRGRIECAEFPLIVMTSNGERDFPPAFLRRCIRLELAPPSNMQLEKIVQAHLDGSLSEDSKTKIKEFAEVMKNKTTATDQLLNALFLVHEVSGKRPLDQATNALYQTLVQPLE